jgi:hypothetical protein
MTSMQTLREMARKHGIRSFGRSRVELIRAIQRAEGNFDCFGRAGDFCDQEGCLFRSLCLADRRKAPKTVKP